MARGEGTGLLTPARPDAVTRVLTRVLALNLCVAAAKLALGYATGTVSVISDGYHSLADAAANVIGLIGLRLSRKPPDIDHPYGHRKFETLAAGGIFLFLVLAVFDIGRTALRQVGSTTSPTVTWLSFAVMLATLAVNVGVMRYESSAGRRLNSELLLADSLHARSDVLATVGVLVSLTALRLGYPQLDPLAGICIAILIARTSYEIARDATPILSDRMVIDEDSIRRVVLHVPEVLGCHHIRTRGSPDHVFLDLHIWLPSDARLADAHRVSHIVKDRLTERFPQIADAIIHIEPPPDER